jgi:hypothetical protein
MLSKFQILIDRSAEHEAKNLPNESKIRQLTVFEWALTDFSFVNSSHSQVIIEASSDPLTNIL